MAKRDVAVLPSDVSDEVSWFDKFAERATTFVARAPFFAFCLLAVVVWAVTGPIFKFGEGWQLVINTGTTIITFLMVALLENATKRADQAVQHKLNAIAEALIDILQEHEGTEKDQDELRRAVGLELKEST